MVDVVLHDAAGSAPYRDAVLRVWCEVFGAVDDEDEWTQTVWERHRARAGFRLATAEAGDRLVGFAWGYTGQPGQFWSDLVLRTVGPVAAEWVGGHFELVELAVVADTRGRGVGARLHDLLLAGLPHERALLGTSDDPNSPAVRLYTSRGWQRLGKQSEHDQVMGKLLKADLPKA